MDLETQPRSDPRAAERRAPAPTHGAARAPEAAEADLDRVHRVFEAQRANRWRTAQTGARERTARLRALRAAIERRREELCDAVFGDFAKPAAEMEITELWPTLIEIGHTIEHLPEWMRPHRVGAPLLLLGTRAEVRHEPKGQALVLSPWNYPFFLTLAPLVAAVAAGNTVMVRPSEKVPRVARFIRSLVEEVFPEDEVAVLQGGRDVADALLELPFDHVFFTGSTPVGKKVMAAAAKHLASVTLELGGKSPAIVDETARVEDAAARIVWGKFVNAGQTCVAPDYVFVHESVEDRFVRAVEARIAAQYGGTEESRRGSPDFARIVDRASAARLVRTLEETVSRGAKIAVGGAHDVETRYVAPTVLTGVPGDSAIMEGEIFGPILPVLRYRDVEEVFAYVRSRPKPLALYVFSEGRANVERIIRGTTAGGTGVNIPLLHLANPNLPFGGVGESGVGSYHGFFGFRAFSHERAVLRQRRPALIERFFPPYGPAVKKRLLALARRIAR
jgi:aldehyde dehydrogenase (NAD+)